MSSPLSHSSSVLIVGAGTWGCSTALHLARRGYQNVTVLDPYPIPSPIPADNDVKKVSPEPQSPAPKRSRPITVGREKCRKLTTSWEDR